MPAGFNLHGMTLLLLALLATALALQTKESSSPDLEKEDVEYELDAQRDVSEVMAAYQKMAEEHAELIQFRHEVEEMGFFCSPCKKAVKYLASILEDSNEEEAKKKLEEKCKTYSNILKKGCKYLVKKYFTEIWDYVKDNADPKKVCKKIRLC